MITVWQTKQLNYWGRVVLINNVLKTLQIQLISPITPPAPVLKQIHMLIPDYFWLWKSDKKKYHWASWKNLNFPFEEGGVGMKNVKDVGLDFQYK